MSTKIIMTYIYGLPAIFMASRATVPKMFTS